MLLWFFAKFSGVFFIQKCHGIISCANLEFFATENRDFQDSEGENYKNQVIETIFLILHIYKTFNAKIEILSKHLFFKKIWEKITSIL